MLKMLYVLAPVLGVLLLVKFFANTNKSQRIAVLLGWLFPGLGHVYLGHMRRGLFLGGIVVATFLAGMYLADWRNISPFDRHPVWGLAHLFGGLMSGAATLLTRDLMIMRDNPFYHVGCLYSGAAALLNILVMIDAYDMGDRLHKVPRPEEDSTAEAAA